MALKNLFTSIDTFIFKQIDTVEEHPLYARLMDRLSVGDEELQGKINNAITVILVLIPIAVVTTLFFMNLSLRDEIEKKQKIIEISGGTLETMKELRNAGRQVFANNPIESQAEFTEQIRSAAQAATLDTSKIKALNFKNEVVFSGLKRSEIDVEFSDLTSADITTLASNLVVMRRMKISGVGILKNRQSGLLAGTFHLVNFGRAEAGGEEGE